MFTKVFYFKLKMCNCAGAYVNIETCNTAVVKQLLQLPYSYCQKKLYDRILIFDTLDAK